MSFTIGLKQPMHEKVAHYIRRGILLGKWQFHEHLSEKQVAEELGLSRGPVRDAIKLLHVEGIIEVGGNGRPIIVGFNEKSFSDWMRMRLQLEEIAVMELDSSKKAPLQELKMLISEMEEVQASQDQQRHIWLDLQFHQKLVEASENRALLKLWQTLSPTLSTMLELISEGYEAKEQIAMHKKIVLQLEKNEKKEAVSSLEEHINAGEAVIRNVIHFLK